MLIPALFATFLLGDPDPMTPDPMTNDARLDGSALSQAALLSFDASAYGDLALPPASSTPPDLVIAEPIPREKDESAFSYSYAEAGYSVTKLDALNHNAEAIYLKGSFEFLKLFHVITGIEREDTNLDNARLFQFELGGGVHISLLDRLDVVGELAYLVNTIDSNVSSADTNEGWMGYAGARFMPLQWDRGGLEVLGGLRYTVINSFLSHKDSTAFELGVRGHFLDRMSVGLKGAYIQNDRMLAVDFRFSF